MLIHYLYEDIKSHYKKIAFAFIFINRCQKQDKNCVQEICPNATTPSQTFSYHSHLQSQGTLLRATPLHPPLRVYASHYTLW